MDSKATRCVSRSVRSYYAVLVRSSVNRIGPVAPIDDPIGSLFSDRSHTREFARAVAERLSAHGVEAPCPLYYHDTITTRFWTDYGPMRMLRDGSVARAPGRTVIASVDWGADPQHTVRLRFQYGFGFWNRNGSSAVLFVEPWIPPML